MTMYSASFSEIEADFIAHGIPIEQPAFYDHPQFMEVERQDSRYLNNYARLVHERPRDTAYDEHVRRTAPVIARVFHQRLKENGRVGACVDISGVISRALEREGIWNYIVKGSLTIKFPKKSKIATKYFWSIDSGQFTAAHAWVVAPPFYVVDTAIQLQPYSGNEAAYLPDVICSEADTLTQGTLVDIVSSEARAFLSAMGVPKAQQLTRANSELPTFMNVFPARILQFGETSLKFIPVAITAPDIPFESMRAILFAGKTGFEIYSSDVRSLLT